MNYPQAIIAQRYAQAYINLYGNALSYRDFLVIRDTEIFFKKNRQLLFFLNWSAIKIEEKKEALRKAMEYCAVHHSINNLIDLLALHKRLFLIIPVLTGICALYQKKHKITQVMITSSHAMTDQELKSVQQFLANKTGLSIIYDYKVDPKLIAGIRLQGDTFLWEHSIKKQLESIRLPLIR